MNISHETIAEMRNFVYKLDYEICGNLRKKNYNTDELIIYHMTKGKRVEYDPGRFRGKCEYEMITSVLFHSHAINMYSYPSAEDILQVIKKYDIIKRSIIATKWGIWDIQNTQKSNIYSSEYETIIYKRLKYFLDRIGLRTSSSTDDLRDDDLDVINYSINRITEELHIKINLHLWRDIEDGLVLDIN